MKKTTFLLLSLLLMVAVTNFANAQQDPKAVAILSKAKKSVNKMRDITATFQQSVRTQKGATVGTGFSGSLKMKGDKFRVQLKNQLVICDGKTQWSVNELDEEVLISKYNPEEGFSAERIFQFSMENMKVRYGGEETVSGVSTHFIQLFPTTKEDYWRFDIFVDMNDMPRKMEVYYRDGRIESFSLSNVKTNQGLGDDVFSFSKSEFPGFYVEDMR